MDIDKEMKELERHIEDHLYCYYDNSLLIDYVEKYEKDLLSAYKKIKEMEMQISLLTGKDGK